MAGHQRPTKRALVVQRDPHTRKQICDQLIYCGYEVDACATLGEGRSAYTNQLLVITSMERDPEAPNGFVAWLHEHHPNEEDRPYILAVSDPAASLATPPENRAWDELLITPLNAGKLRARLQAIDHWVENRLAHLPTQPHPTRPRLDPKTTAVSLKMQPQFTETEEKPLIPAPPSKIKPLKPPTQRVPAAHRLRPQREAAPVEQATLSPLQQFQALIDNSPLAMAMFDRELRYLVVNKRWLRDFRLEGADVIGRSHYEIFPHLGQEWKRVYEKSLQGVTERCDEDLWVRADGSQDWVRWEVQPWVSSSGQVRGITITCEVINHLIDRRDTRDLEQIGRSLLRGQVTPVLCLDMDGRIEQASNGCAMFQANEGQDVAGLCFWEAFSLPERADAIERQFLAAAKATAERGHFAFPATFVDKVRLSAGGITNVAWSNSPLYDGEGRTLGIVCVGVLLGDDKVMQAELAKTQPVIPLPSPHRDTPARPASPQAEQSLVWDQVAFGVILLGPDGRTIYTNPGHRNLIGTDVTDYHSVEEWLRQAIPDPLQAGPVLQTFREDVLGRHEVRSFTLRTRENVLRELEFRPQATSSGTILTVFDVTASRRVIEKLGASEAKFKALFQHDSEAVALEDYAGDFFDVNPRFEELTRAERNVVQGSKSTDWFHPEDIAPIQGIVRSLETPGRPDGVPVSLEVRVKQKIGSFVRCRLTISIIGNRDGRLAFRAYALHELSKESNTSSVAAAPTRNRALVEAMPDLVLMLDSQGRVLDALPSSQGVLTNEPANLLGRSLTEAAPSLTEQLNGILRSTLTQQHITVQEFSERGPDGSERSYEARFMPYGNQNVVAIIQDTTATRQSQDALQRHSLAFDYTWDGIVMTDLHGRITDWNPAAERIFGYKRVDMVGQSLSTVFSPDDRNTFNRMVADALSNRGYWSCTMPFYRPDGSSGACDVYYVAIDDENGDPASIIGINREVGANPKVVNDAGDAIHELRHRINNDLQIIISLVSLQLNYVSSQNVRYALRLNQERIRTIALIHQFLKASTPGVARINIASYLQMLRRSILQTYEIQDDVIAVEMECMEALMPASQALALGLILTEFLGEVLAHASMEGRSGVLSITLITANGWIDFRIKDDGLEFPDTLMHPEGEHFTMDVIRTLAEQLQAEFTLTATPYKSVRLRFPIFPAQPKTGE